MTSALSGCLVAFFAHWLRTRNNKKGDKEPTPK
ncbi:type I toxin-antitoxin system Fst family toxin [Staphylococcus aureus]|nr:type I toxin-antitoxin system Fst family toxin [Staphylococcus aureus]